MMKKSQIELAGLAIVMLLVILTMAYLIKFAASNKPGEHKKEFAQTEMASNMLNTFLASTSRNCNNLSITELLQECSQDSSVNGAICPDNLNPCDYVKQELQEIFNKTLEKWNINYEFKVFKDEKNPIFSLGSKCGADKKSKVFPLPTNSGILYAGLDICETFAQIKQQCSDETGYCDNLTQYKKEDDCVPSPEICDALDNNCNKLIDEDLPVECYSNFDCGTSGWLGDTYCGTGENVYRKWIDYTCSNPEECSSTCSSQLTDKVYASCSYNCLNGACLLPQCSDGMDNDGDTYIDHPSDLGCTSLSDNSELGDVQCDDGIDNDGDSLIDYPKDSGCSDIFDDSEYSTYCGDRICNGGETCTGCPSDCRSCPKGGVNFKTYKGLNFPWGINNKGISAFRDWLSSKYDEQVTAKSFEEIKNMGVKTVGMWLWLDRMLVKDASWGTDAYVTKFDPTFKANWESFLKNVVKAKDMEVVVTMFTPLSSTEKDPYNLELSTLVPVFAGADILGAGIANGDMTVDANSDNSPDGWSVGMGNPPAGSSSWENNDGTPGSPAKYLKVTSTTNTININSPKVPYTSQGRLYALSVTYKGALVSFRTTYYDSNGKYLDGDSILAGDPKGNPKGYSDNWKTFTWASRTAVIPDGTVQIGITAVADSNAITYIGPARIAPGARNAKWRNYMQASKDWVSMYGSNTEYGPAVASWHGIKEVSDGWMFHVTRDFSRDLYQAIKSTGTTQPVGIDNSPYFRLAVTKPENQPWFNDAADYYSLHMYNDDGTIPDTSNLDKPFILGEFGAEWRCPNGGSPQDGDCKPTETNLANPNADWNLNAVSKFYPNGQTAGAKTALGWAWVSNPTIAEHKLDGTNVLGNAGQWIKEWNP